MRVNKTAEATVEIEAPVEAVWEMVSDVTRAGEWSGECRGVEWMDGATAADAGARFRGRNRRNGTRWSRVCEVVDVDPPHRLAWRTLPTRLYPDSTQWQFELASTAFGTRLTERMQILRIPPLHDRLYALMLPQHRDRCADLQADLQRIKGHLERGGE